MIIENIIYYHASQVGGISILEPRVSNHNIPLIYLSKKRENVLVYLSNAIEKYCKEKGMVIKKTDKKERRESCNRETEQEGS